MLCSTSSIKDQLHLAVKYFNSGKYVSIVNSALDCYNAGDLFGARKFLAKLPDKEILLKDLMKVLLGKPLVKTWNKVLKGNGKNKYTEGKALFSLGSHICIELEKGNTEYLMLLEDVYSRIGKFLVS